VIGTVVIEIFMEITCQNALLRLPPPWPNFNYSSPAFWVYKSLYLQYYKSERPD